jgi:tRNA threonylcarbamoyladenosine biosynthesis protein TsaE
MATDNPVTEPPSPRRVGTLGETEVLARELLPLLRKARIVSLEGPLGAGKTHFVKAVARVVGLTEEVTSPTFTLLQSYGSGDTRIHHSDWYRLESEGEVLAMALEDYYGEGIFFIEWGDKFFDLLPPGTLRIKITPSNDDSREISWHQASA